MTGEFSVYQSFSDGHTEAVRRFVSAKEAAEAFKHYATSVATKLGVVEWVRITDGGDFCVAEWTKEKGYTFPPELVELTKEKA